MKTPIFFISFNDLRIINGGVPDYQDPYGEKIPPIRKQVLDSTLSKGDFNKSKYVLNVVDPYENLLKVEEINHSYI